jgi:hypothetical protein
MKGFCKKCGIVTEGIEVIKKSHKENDLKWRYFKCKNMNRGKLNNCCNTMNLIGEPQ